MPVSDDDLVDRLRSIAGQADPAPPELAAAARAAFALRTVDAELAELVRDSLDTVGATVRAGDDDRLLSFETGADGDALAVEIQVSDLGERRDLVVAVSGPALAAASLDTAAGRQPVPADDGVLVVRAVPAGPVRLLLTTRSGRTVATSWVTV